MDDQPILLTDQVSNFGIEILTVDIFNIDTLIADVILLQATKRDS